MRKCWHENRDEYWDENRRTAALIGLGSLARILSVVYNTRNRVKWKALACGPATSLYGARQDSGLAQPFYESVWTPLRHLFLYGPERVGPLSLTILSTANFQPRFNP